MIDFAAIRRRAESMQESSGLGTPEHASSQDVLELLAELQKGRQTIKRLDQACDNLNIERDEARELHAKVCDMHASACADFGALRSRLNREHRELRALFRCELREGSPLGENMLRIINGEPLSPELRAEIDDPEAVSQHGAFVGPAPHE